MRKYHINEYCFDLIDSEHAAYFYGLLLADGYNSEDRGAISLILSEKDADIVEEFALFVATNRPICYRTYGKVSIARLELSSRHMSRTLSLLGCGQNKTFQVCFPQWLEERLYSHFIRGYFDGDGCISYSYARRNNVFGSTILGRWQITSTESMCLSMQAAIAHRMGIHSSIYSNGPKIKTIAVNGNKQVKAIMDWMYNGASVFLKRKRDRYLDFERVVHERAEMVRVMRQKNGEKIMQTINLRRKDAALAQNI